MDVRGLGEFKALIKVTGSYGRYNGYTSYADCGARIKDSASGWKLLFWKLSNVTRKEDIPLSSTSISKFKSFNQGQTRLVIDLYNGTSFIITAKEKRDKAILVHVDIFLGSLLNEPKTTPGKSQLALHRLPSKVTPPKSSTPYKKASVSPVSQHDGPVASREETKYTSVKERVPAHDRPNVYSSSTPLAKQVHDEGEDSKENRLTGGRSFSAKKAKQEQFLQRGTEKSRERLQSLPTAGFYGSQATQVSYVNNFIGVKRPGLMPDPIPLGNKKPRYNNVPYSWDKNKPKFAPDTTQTNQTVLHGFSNLGNTCYMNAILQALFGLDTFASDLVNHGRLFRAINSSSLYYCMAKLLKVKKQEISCYEEKKNLLKKVKLAISQSAKRFSGYEQHDAHEFLGQVLDQLKEEVDKVIKSTPSPEKQPTHNNNNNYNHSFINPTVQNFEFEVLHTIKCQECGEEVTKEETFHDLSLDAPRRNPVTLEPRSLQDALDQFFRREEIEYSCEKCSGKVSHVKHTFTRLPRILVLHLKRYSFNTVLAQNRKIGQNVKIPRYLTLQAHSNQETQPAFPPPSIATPKTTQEAELRSPPAEATRRKLDYPPKSPRSDGTFNFKRMKPLTDSEKDFKPSLRLKHKLYTKEERELQQAMENSKREATKRQRKSEEEESQMKRALELSVKKSSPEKESIMLPVEEEEEEDDDEELQKVLELSRQENEKKESALNASTMENMSEDEMIRMALEQSLNDSRPNLSPRPPGGVFSNDTDSSTGGAVLISSEGESEDPIIPEHFAGNAGPALGLNNPHGAMEQPMIGLKGGAKNIEGAIIRSLFDKARRKSAEKIAHGEKDDCDNVPKTTSGLIFHSDESELSQDETPQGEEHQKLENSTHTQLKSPQKTLTGIATDSKGADLLHDLEPSGKVVDSADPELGKTMISKSSAEAPKTPPQGDLADVGEDKENCVPDQFQAEEGIDLTQQPELTAPSTEEFDLEEAYRKSLDEENARQQEEEDELRKAKELSLQEYDAFSSLPLSDDEDETESKEETYNIPRSQEEIKMLEKNAETGELPYSFKLASVVCHIGSTSSSGHYISDVYDAKKRAWLSYDDSQVTKTTEKDVRSQRERSGYIFFYVNKDILEDVQDQYRLTSHHSHNNMRPNSR